MKHLQNISKHEMEKSLLIQKSKSPYLKTRALQHPSKNRYGDILPCNKEKELFDKLK